MKKLIFTALMLVAPLICEAREPVSLAGTYEDCVQWTTFNGVPTSKKFALTLGEDDSISYVVSFYDGSAVCEGGKVEVIANYHNFSVIDDMGRGYPARIMTIHAPEDDQYFKIMLTGEYADVTSSDTLPVKYDFMREVILKKIQ